MKIKRFLSLLLILLLLIPIFSAPAAFAASKPYTYVALGDSIPAGYGLTAPPSDSYVPRLAGMVGAGAMYNLAKDGMDASDLLNQLNDPSVAAMLSGADLITVSIGSNDLLGILIDMLDVSKISGAFSSPTEWAKLVQSLTDPSLQAKFNQAIQGFSVKLPQIIAKIRSINSSATLVFTNAYNPFSSVNITLHGVALDMNAVSDPAIVKLNQVFLQNASAVTMLAKVYEPFRSAAASGVQYTNVNVKNMPFNVDPHPNVAGHKCIANTIYSMIKSQIPEPVEPLMIAKLVNKARAAKSEGATPMYTLNKGSRVVVYSWNDQYVKIGYKREYVYVKRSDVDMDPIQGSPVNLSSVKSNVTVFTSTKENKKLCSVYKYNQLMVLTSGKTWSRVQVGGQVGYIRTKYLTKLK